eukprot:TRINITY_DN3491_c0_g1_i1.p1 TRINITY_DN3491_c0_g1~~TRINITY_DN3491_c0_g1_i1.p1  ORF type:complete len:497 (+),score=187.79 TRINITY_DN3491_c0_g1_i1:81-1571(+)
MSLELIVSAIVIAAVTLVVLAAAHWWMDTNIPGMPPGPKGIPILFNFLDIVKNKSRIYDWTLDQSLETKSLVWTSRINIFTPRTVSIADPACAEYILKDNFANYIKGEFFCQLAHDFFGDGIFNTNGAPWKSQRQVASHMFTTKELRSYVSIYRRHALDLTEILKEHQRTDMVIDVQNLFSRCTLDSIGDIAFGKNIDSLHHKGTFSDAFNLAQTAVDGRIFTPMWKYLPFAKCERDMKSSTAVLDDYIYGLIRERRDDENLANYTDLLSRYLQLADENDQPFSDRYIRDIVINIMIAGRDTTAQTLTWCSYLLSQNPQIYDKLKEVIKKELGDNEPNYDNVRPIKYLQAVIDETLRMYPPVPIDPKMAVEDDVLPGGYVVKKGMLVQWNQWVMGRHPAFWDKPLEMRPERWFDEGNNGGKPVPRANQPPFIPFQYGPRVCLGIQFAYLEVKVILCTILQAGLRMECQPSPPVQPHSAVTLSAAFGIPMKIRSVEN